MTSVKPNLLLVALCGAAFAQSPPPKPGHLDGSVTNAKTGAPVANVLVTLEGKQRYGARTTSDGKFSWDRIEPGDYRLNTTLRGYMGASQQVSLRSEAVIHDRDLKIVPEGVLSGRVLDENGDPMENVTVQAVVDSDGFAVGSDTTDDRGQFRIGTPIAKCRVRAVPRELPMPAEIRSDGTHETAYRTTYFPSVPNAAAAMWVQLESGGERGGVEIRLLPMPIIRVSGTVAGVPQGADNVWAYFRGEDSEPHQAPVKKGGFTAWRLPPGKYMVNVGAHGGDGRTYTTMRQEIELMRASIDGLQFELVPEFELSGGIQWDGAPASGEPKVRLESRDDGVRRSDKPLTSAISAGLIFRIPKVTVGTYEVAIEGLPANVWVKSIIVDGQASQHPWLEMRAAPESVKLLLSTATGQVSGMVEDTKGPAAGAQVILTPERDFGWIFERKQKSDADGKYSFEGVPPGKYTVTLRREAEEKASIDVSEGGHVTSNLKVKN